MQQATFGGAPVTVNSTGYSKMDQPEPQEEWDSGVFGCCSESCGIQCLACFCPCYLYAQIATSEVMMPSAERNTGGDCEDGHCDCSGFAARACGYCLLDHVAYSVLLAMSSELIYCPFMTLPLSCLIHCGTRKKIRNLKPGRELEGSCSSDVFYTFCCACCALVQEHRQVKNIQHINATFEV